MNLEQTRAFLVRLAAALDLPKSKYEDAKDRYDAVGRWLNEQDSPLAAFAPEIYPQGSFALGTAIRPPADGDFDVDAVCRLNLRPNEIDQRQLKDLVGDRLKAHKTYQRMLDPPDGGRRCWTLRYHDESKFHLDILPSIPDIEPIAVAVPEVIAREALLITDLIEPELAVWPRSNPRGYALWFKDRMALAFEKARRDHAFRVQASVESIQDYEIRTPLQQVVQLLKRHRDMTHGEDDDRPISIIITTLAAKAYDNETDLLDALLAVVPKMRSQIERRGGAAWVPNPTNPDENFADKWAETPRKERLFFQWLSEVEALHAELGSGGLSGRLDRLRAAYGPSSVNEALRQLGLHDAFAAGTSGTTRDAAPLAQPLGPTKPSFDVPHRQRPSWPVASQGRVTLRAKWRASEFSSWTPFEAGGVLPKGLDLMFDAGTTVPGPFTVYWQVVNTGPEATARRGLRGSIEKSDRPGAAGLRRPERTEYEGTHWIECYLVRGGACVGRSREFVVNIR